MQRASVGLSRCLCRRASAVAVASYTALPAASPVALATSSAAIALQPTAQRRFVLSETMRGMNTDKLSDVAIANAIFRRLGEPDFQAIDRIYTAYLEYFSHIKFHKEWDKPKYVKEEIEPMLREAAE